MSNGYSTRAELPKLLVMTWKVKIEKYCYTSVWTPMNPTTKMYKREHL